MNNTISFIIMALIAGSISGLIYAGLNLLIIEPYIDEAIALEIDNLIMEGVSIDNNEIYSYRIWQKEGSILAGVILGIGLASIFALVYPYARRGIKGNEVKRGLIIASILWIVLFLVPFLKYPANPPGVGDAATINYRQGLYLVILAISASLALSLAYVYKHTKRYKFVLPIIYALVIAVAFITLPDNPDEITISMDLVNGFRAVSLLSSLITWLFLGSIFGMLYNRFIKELENFA